jgi:hypothetical protein
MNYYDPANIPLMRQMLIDISVKEKFTIIELAKLAGISLPSMHRFIHNKSKAGPKTVLAVAHVLDKYKNKL